MLSLLTIALLGSTAPAALEASAATEVLRAFERVGRLSPEVDPALGRAARRLAEAAALGRTEDAAELLALTHALSFEGAADPSPRTLVIRTSPPEEILVTLRARKDLAEDPASHLGVGVAVKDGRGTLVLLLARRQLTLEPFPRRLEKPGEAKTFCASLQRGLTRPVLFVTRPGGAVDKVPVASVKGQRFCALLSFPGAGSHTVEILATGSGGPLVAGLFLVDVGTSAPRAALERRVEPSTPEAARAAILLRVNALRAAHGLSPVKADEALDALAQGYSERMAREGFFAHVAPDGSDLRQRLTAARYRYKGAGENLGLAGGPLAAHFGIEHSPGHRRNLLDPTHQRLGLGIAEQLVGGRKQVLLTEVLVSASDASDDPVADAYRRIAEHRSRHSLPPLRKNEALERIAREHAKRALALDAPKSELPGSNVHERVFAELADAKSAAVEVYVADAADQLPDSQAVADARNRQVGLGLVRGDSKTHGRDRLWVVVIYAASAERR